MLSQPSFPTPNPINKRKRSLPGTPDPDADVIALSPSSLMATNRFVCEICNKGFQRDQNLQLHRRGHNLPWKLRTRAAGEQVRKKVYVCPEKGCVHNDPSRALGDLTGIKKHFSRKHGEKNWKCQKCSKKYAVQSDCKAHSKVCGTKEYRCDCGTLFSRKDSFVTHRAFCDALSEESVRLTNAATFRTNNLMIANNMNVSSSTIPMSTNFPPNFAADIFCGSPSFNNGFQEFHQAQNPTYMFSQQNHTDWHNSFPAPPPVGTILKQEDERYGDDYPETLTNPSFNEYHQHYEQQQNNMSQTSSSKPYVVVDENVNEDDDDNLNELLCDLNWNNNGGGSSLLGECRGLTRDFLGVGEENRFFRNT